jgi:hypothetical protein
MWKKEEQNHRLQTAYDQLINRACYCHLWNYDCIFNQTQELTLLADINNNNNTNSSHRWWLQFGCWERVAHLQAILPKYDWVLYGDLDYIIKDMSRPIESFLRELELHGHKDTVHVIVPTNPTNLVFSSFAVLIRNSPFGRKVIQNWREFGMGLCPNGNFAPRKPNNEYHWSHSDQPGLWYALMKTHMEFFPNKNRDSSILPCNNATGLIADKRVNKKFLYFHEYFSKNGYKPGSYGKDLEQIPKDQAIIFSKSGNTSLSGLGINKNANYAKPFWPYAFAFHDRLPSSNWDPSMQKMLALCKSNHGCSASIDDKSGSLKVQCGADAAKRNSSATGQ